MRYLFLSLTLLSFLLLTSCTKDEPNEHELLYQDMLATLKPPTIGDSSGYYLKLKVQGEQWTYYDSESDPSWEIRRSAKYVTLFPSTGIGQGGGVKYLRSGVSLRFPDRPSEPGVPEVYISMPDFDSSKSLLSYIDSMFAIPNHHVMSGSEIMIPEGVPADEVALTEATGGILTGWKVEIRYPTIDPPHSEVFINSVRGPQEDSYVYLEKAERSVVGVTVKYKLHLKFRANLYTHPQYNGWGGLFSVADEGELIGFFTVRV
jgi:hypothetical protein